MKPSFSFKYLGSDQRGLYERVIINRKEQTTAVDRIDANFWFDDPFLGRRDLFYNEQREGKDECVAFVRHDFWLFKPMVLYAFLQSNFASLSYKWAF